MPIRTAILLLISPLIVIIGSIPLFISFVSTDMHDHLLTWYAHAQKEGFSYVKNIQSDYPPLYLYIIWILTQVPFKAVYAIKCFSMIFNFLTALAVRRVVLDKYGESSWIPGLAYGIILLSPAAFLNSMMWGQCDSIHTFFTIASLWCLMQEGSRKKILTALVLYGTALSCKLQPVFLLPVFLIVLRHRKTSLWYFLILPAVFFLTVSPALIAGRDIRDLLLLPGGYLSYPRINYSTPNVYALLPHWRNMFMLGNVFCLMLVTSLVILVNRHYQKAALPKETILKLAFFFSIALPFFLPKMHERYLFLADILSIAYAFYRPRYFYVPVCTNLASLFSYSMQLHILYPFLWQGAILNLISLTTVTQDMIRDFYKDKCNEIPGK